MSILRRISHDIGQQTNRSVLLGSFVIMLIAWIPVEIAVGTITHFIEVKYDDPFGGSMLRKVLGGVLLAPLLETLAMKYMFKLGGRWITDPVILNAVCAALWGPMHLNAPAFGIHAVWPFFVMGVTYQFLSQSRNENYALLYVALVHSLYNALTFAMNNLT